jgi:hypothetical protein
MLAAFALGLHHASAAGTAAPETALTETGQKLLTQYSDMLTALRAEISQSLPAIDEQKKATFLAAREAVKEAEAAVTAAQQPLDKIQGAKARVEELLADPALMKEMLEADGARGGKYGQAMQIYTDIRKAGPLRGGRAESGQVPAHGARGHRA